MSQDITFIRTQNLDLENVYRFLETEVTQDDEHFVSKDLMNKLIVEIKELGFDFEVFDYKNEDGCELNFATYQVAMYNSEITISVPYWDENSSEKIDKEIKQITNVLIENGFSGFDSQTEEFITQKYQFKTAFTESKTVVDNHLILKKEKGNTTMYIGVSLCVLLIGYLVWKMFK